MKRNFFSISIIIMTGFILLALSACDNTNSNSNNVQTSSKTLSDCITYIADKKVENKKYTVDVKIPQITFDKPGAKSINEQIKAKFYTNEVQTTINGGFEGIQLYIRTDASLNGNILSLRIRQELNPSYGTDGEVYTVCYDISKDILVTPAQYMKDKGYDYSKVVEETKTAFGKETTDHIEYFDIEGIYINEKAQIEVVANILVHPIKSDSWKIIYTYIVK